MAVTTSARRWFFGVAATATVVAGGLTQATAGAPRAPQVPPSAPTVSVEADVASHPSLSGDGRWIVYQGAPPAGDSRHTTVYLRDRTDNSVTELTTLASSVRAGDSVMPVISADGCVVVVITEMAYDLFRDDDTGSRWDVYRLTLPQCGGTLGNWDLVSASSGAGLEASATDDVDPTSAPAVNGSGTVIAYTHAFAAGTPDLTGIVVVDLTVPLGQPGHSRPVAGTPGAVPNTTFRYHGLRDPALSDDGEVIAYTSDADSAGASHDWGTGPTPGGFATARVYAWDRTSTDPATAVTLVSGATADGDAGEAAVSGNGRYVAFSSSAHNLVPGAVLPACEVTCKTQVFRVDRNDGTLVLVSRQEGDSVKTIVGADLGAWQASMSYDGEDVTFVTRAGNLFATNASSGGGFGDGDIVVANPSLGTLNRVSVLPDGITPAPAAHSHPHMSATGRVIVFDTLAGWAFGATAQSGRQVVTITQTPVLTLADLDVGTVAVTFPGPEWYIAVFNRGPSSFLPATIKSSNPDFDITGGTCENLVPLPPGASCTVNITLTPSHNGPETGTLTVAEAGFGAASVSSTLRGSGGDPTLAPTPAGIDFGSVKVGAKSAPSIAQIGNVSFGPVTMGGLSIQGADPQDFKLVSSGCPGAQIQMGLTCPVTIVFTPTASGHRTASLRASSKDGFYTTVLLAGDAYYTPTLAVTSSTVQEGRRIGVAGNGFAPNSSVTLLWADGTGRRTVVTTDAKGSFLVSLAIATTERPGKRILVAQSVTGDSASVPLTLVPVAGGFNANSPAWPRP